MDRAKRGREAETVRPSMSGPRTGPPGCRALQQGQGQTKGGPCVRPEQKCPLSDDKELQVVEEG